jgi:hypothetical protein
MVKRGRPFEPGNKVGGGRPRGSRNKRGLLAQQLLDSHEEAVIRKALVLALQGDTSILRTLVGHILPRRGDPPVKTGPLPMGTADELAKTSEAVLKRVASGQITTSAALEIFAMVEARRKVIATVDLDARVRAIEQRSEPAKK